MFPTVAGRSRGEGGVLWGFGSCGVDGACAWHTRRLLLYGLRCAFLCMSVSLFFFQGASARARLPFFLLSHFVVFRSMTGMAVAGGGLASSAPPFRPPLAAYLPGCCGVALGVLARHVGVHQCTCYYFCFPVGRTGCLKPCAWQSFSSPPSPPPRGSDCAGSALSVPPQSVAYTVFRSSRTIPSLSTVSVPPPTPAYRASG